MVSTSPFFRETHCLLGLPFDAVSMGEAVQRIRRSAESGRPCFLSTPNLNFLVACQSDEAFRNSVINSDLSVADGMPLVWVARLLKVPVRERVAGSAVFEQLQVAGEHPRLSVFFFGGLPGVAEQACRRLNSLEGGIHCVGWHDPGFGSIDDMSEQSVIDKINASGADFVVVALGAKKGQAWIEHNRARLSAPIISHLGAVINFVAGSVSRAPVWMQRCGLEWLWRIKEEPSLWRRYLGDGFALLHLLASCVLPLAWYVRRHQPRAKEIAAAAISASREGDGWRIEMAGAWSQGNLVAVRKCFDGLLEAEGDVLIELDKVTSIDSAVLGMLTLLYGHQRRIGRKFRLTGANRHVGRFIALSRASYLMQGLA